MLGIGLSLGPSVRPMLRSTISGFDPKQEVTVNNLAIKASMLWLESTQFIFMKNYQKASVFAM